MLRLIVGSSFDSNFRNQPDPTISFSGTDRKPKLIPINLKSTQLDPTRISVPIFGIESSRQEIAKYVKNTRDSIN